MVRERNKNKKAYISLTTVIIVLISAVTGISGLTHASYGVTSDTAISQVQTGAPTINGTDINQTNTQNPTNNSSTPTPTKSVSTPVSLETSDFKTYTYGGDPVQQSGQNQFFFSLPNSTNQGKIAGSDAISLNSYPIQRIDFNAVFKSPKINAAGFDEMVIFAASNTITYKGTEFGIRMDVNNGLIYGYIQEPNGDFGDVNFQMVPLTSNDGLMHHYTLIALGSEVSFWIDGADLGHLSFPSNQDSSGFTFSVCAVVHRFSDDWDSVGDNMTVENLALNQP
jgi:hypothetical protein